MSDIVGTSVCDESFSGLDISGRSSNAQEQDINDLWQQLKVEENKYLQYKIIYDALEECVSENGDLDRPLKTKVSEIMLSGSVKQCLALDEYVSSKNTALLLGFSGLNNEELNYIERNKLQEVLKSKLNRKYKSICHEFHKITNEDVDKALENADMSPPLHMTSDDKLLIEYKNKLLSEQELYIKNLLCLLELLDEITNLRLKKLPEVTDQKVRECQVEDKINQLKSLLAQEKVRVDVFTETRSSLKAYKELIKDIKEQQSDCEKEIQELKNLKEKYRQVSCEQYDNILKSYLEYKSSIEKKKLLYGCLKS